MEKNFFNCSQ